MILAATSIAPPPDRILDGRDPTATLAQQKPSPHDALHWLWNQGRREQWRGMRRGQYKLVRKSDTEPWQLYDLSQDLAETHDLAATQPDLLKNLIAQFDSWQHSVASDPTRSASTRK
jgi:arylsulfatase